MLEILEKADNDLTLGILSSMKEAAILKKLTGEKEDSIKKDSLEFNKDDIDKVKKVLSYLNKLEVTEGN